MVKNRAIFQSPGISSRYLSLTCFGSIFLAFENRVQGGCMLLNLKAIFLVNKKPIL